MKINNNKIRLLPIVLFYLLSNFLIAEEGLCTFQSASIINAETFSPDGKTHLKSDSVKIKEKDVSIFDGNVVIQQKDKRIEADHAEYTKSTEQINAKGNIKLITPSIQIQGETASFNLKSDLALLQEGKYQSVSSRARGDAASIKISTPNVTELDNATYTTCAPNNTDWILSAKTLKFDNNTQQGHASHVVVRFKDVPFFYFPYLRFPLGTKRLSGFLFPYIGSSDRHGNEIKTPYYWNIHPQMDATITPRYMSKRGVLLDTKFRYLTEQSNGKLNLEYLKNDKIFKDTRERLQWQHQSQAGLGWKTKVEYNYVADNKHLTDFSQNLNSTSTSYLTRAGNISYNAQNWLLDIKAEDHQILRGANPYKRLPQISLNSRYAIKNNAVNYALQSEVVRFAHADNKVIGDRSHIKPSISYPIRSAAGFFEPTLSLQYSQYNLQQTTGEATLSSSVPTFSLNSGLFFERESHLFNADFLQTLEPQLFYVYVPYKDQSDLPIFDTSAYAFNVNQSFTDYRFNGIDRIGDDNRLTTALTTRFINQENGQESFMARIGQIHYFSDRRVQLPSTATQTRSQSNIIVEVKTQLHAYGTWSLSSQVERDPRINANVITSQQFNYRYSKFNVQLAHRYQINTLKTREIKINWELSPAWQLNYNQLYDLKNEHLVENSLGIHYQSCCWGLQINTRERYLSETESSRSLYLTLILKGLGGFKIRR